MLRLICFATLVTSCFGFYIKTENGWATGQADVCREGFTYYSFNGIPYAKPPTGELRFKAPQPVVDFKEYLVQKPQNICPQWMEGKVIGSEDCLNLNVHTPCLPDQCTEYKPVIVYIHGGSFVEGAGAEYGPKFLISRDVVVVTLNYRLGLFGFLNSENSLHGIPGNNGFKDQVLALKWVRKNIHNFCGNPNNVLLVGESAGGASVHLHTLSKLSTGLFQKAVSMSGLAEDPWVECRPNTLELLGISKNARATDVWASLKQFSMADIMTMQKQNNINAVMKVHEKNSVGLVIEPNQAGAFITRRPFQIIDSQDYTPVPFITGYTSNDGLIAQILTLRDYGRPYEIAYYKDIVPHNRRSNLDVTAKGKEIYAEYFNGNETYQQKLINVATGAYFMSSIPYTVKKQAALARTYLYRFSADTKLNWVKKMIPTFANVKGATHVEDVAHLFNGRTTPPIVRGSIEDTAVNTMVDMFSQFAHYGVPSNNWNPVNPNIGYVDYMEIGITAKPGWNPDKKFYDYWLKFYTENRL